MPAIVSAVAAGQGQGQRSGTKAKAREQGAGFWAARLVFGDSTICALPTSLVRSRTVTHLMGVVSPSPNSNPDPNPKFTHLMTRRGLRLTISLCAG